MPISSYTVIPEIAYELSLRLGKINTVLDVGIGYGIYSAIVRQYLDSGVQPFRVILDGIEAFPKYRNPQWAMYHHVYGQALQEVTLNKSYDAIIMCDVIEHLEKKEGKWQLDRLIAHLNPNGILLVSTPAIFCEQGAVHGNEYERHVSLWAVEDFMEMGYEIIKDGTTDKWQHQMLLAKYTKP
jgi:2-polyprenyl-3-methyl-5-hydroxy-6-metoxy-1,4-benzoquinol methylase